MTPTIGNPKFSEIKAGDQIKVSPALAEALEYYEHMDNGPLFYSVSERQAQAAEVVTQLWRSSNQGEKQRFFEQSVTGLLRQNERSVINDSCAYRGELGRKCAIGMCIDDAVFIESSNEDDLSSRGAMKMVIDSGWGYELYESDFLHAMQKIHDEVPVNKWRERFKRLGEINGLDTLFIDGVQS